MTKSLNTHERLTLLRKRKGVSQTIVGKETGINRVQIGYYEKDTIPEWVNAQKLADYFNVSLDYIYCRSDSERDSIPVSELPEGLRTLIEKQETYLSNLEPRINNQEIAMLRQAPPSDKPSRYYRLLTAIRLALSGADSTR